MGLSVVPTRSSLTSSVKPPAPSPFPIILLPPLIKSVFSPIPAISLLSLPAIILFVTVVVGVNGTGAVVSTLTTPPPIGAVLSVIVLSLTSRTLSALTMAPPPVVAVLPLIVLSLMVAVPKN